MFDKFRGRPPARSGEESDQSADELVSMGRTVMSSGDAVGAIQFFDQALRLDPQHEVGLLSKGIALQSLGRLQEAVACFDRMLEHNPRSSLGWFGKGMLVMEERRLEEALGYLERAQALGYPGAAEAIHMCQQAIAAKAAAHTSSNREAEDLITKSRRLAREDRWQEALACAEQALRLDPSAGGAWTVKGIALGGLGRASEAHAAYDRALAINPHDEDAWFNKGVEFREAGQNEEAIACYDRIIAFMPDYAMAWFNKGAALMVGLRRYQEALVCYEEAQQLGMKEAAGAIAMCQELMGAAGEGNAYSDQSRLWVNKGIELAEAGRLEDTLGYFDRAVKMSPRYSDAWYGKGTTLLNLNRAGEAVACFDRVLQIEPDLKSGWQQMALALTALDRTDEAVACFDQLLQLDPADAVAWLNKGIVLVNAGRPHAAQQCFEQARRLGHPRAEEGLARCRQVMFGRPR